MGIDDGHLVLKLELQRIVRLVDVGLVLIRTLNVLAIPHSIPATDEQIECVVVTDDRRRLRIEPSFPGEGLALSKS